jgi:hypothetical protein
MAVNKLNPLEGGIPFGNTANRPINPIIGTVYYNGQLEILEIYNGTAWVANSAPPATPSIATPTDASSNDYYSLNGGKLSVVFTPGLGGGTPNQYNAYTTAGGFTASNSTSTVTLTGLTPGTSYVVYGTAQNNFGTTVNTANSSAVTPTTRPQTPTVGTATASTSSTNITVTWTLGSNGGKPLTSIIITPYLNGTVAQSSQTASSTSSTSHEFTDLNQGSAYTFKIKSVNANGESLESEATNSVTVTSFINMDYMVLAGGGGGSAVYGAGGGAGGLRSTVTATGRNGTLEQPLLIAKNTNYAVTVGSGGAGGANLGRDNGSNGGNSIFFSVTSLGGGGAGCSQDLESEKSGLSGGCGGGATNDGIAGSGTINQGYNGGSGTNNTRYGSGGGGGTGSAGVNGTTTTGGNGGNGTSINITGTTIVYGGGGGGATFQGGTGGNGGSGGGGNAGAGGTNQNGSSGTVNLGGGGGGASYQDSTNTIGGSGSSGVVILRWLTSAGTITVGAGLTADATGTDGSYSYKRFTAGSGNVSFS